MKWLPVLLVLLLLAGSVSAVNLTFSNSTPTLIPTTVGQYYTDINASNLSWVVIGAIVPEPLVDTFGGGEFGWQLVWLIVFGTLFVIMFGRQKNVIIPLLAFLVAAFFILTVIPQEFRWMAYACATAAAMGVIFYLAVSRR